MSSLQSLREFISERLAAAAEEIFRHCEGTIVQYEEELCRQRRLLDIIWKPQLQLHQIVLPQHWTTEKDLCYQQRNSSVDQEDPEPTQTTEELQEPEPPHIYEEQEEPEPPQVEEEWEEPEPSPIKEEPGELWISQDEKKLDLKIETDTLLEIPTYEENEHSEADLNNPQNFNVTYGQDEEENQHEESTSSTDEETDPQNRDQMKRRDRSHVQNMDNSHISEVLPHLMVIEEEDLYNQQRNFKVEQEEPEPPQIKEEQERLCISQDEEQLDLKQETDTLMEIPSYEKNVRKKMDLKNQQNFNIIDSLDEEGIQYDKSTASTNEETDPQNRDQKKKRDRSHVQNVESSHMSESRCDSDVRKKFKNATLVKKRKQSKKNLNYIRSGERTRPALNLSKDKRSYLCEECGKGFSHKSPFTAHMRTHTEEKPFSCKECDKSFRVVCNLKAHMRTHTGEKPFSCKECDSRFNQSNHLKIHMRTHTGEKPFSCKECDSRFNQSNHLKIHMRTHTGEKPFSCKECDSRFNQSNNLKIHMRTHTGEKPFSCKECDKSFIVVSHLKAHMRTHTGEKPFSCKECGKSFSRLSTLKTHMRIHTGERPFSCKKCGSRFIQLCHLKTHMRTHTAKKNFSCKELYK